jgi:hypothetical protein
MMGLEQVISDEQSYVSKLLNELENVENENFVFHTIELPRVDVCASGVFTYETTEEIRQLPPQTFFNPLTEIYFNLLPEDNRSVVIIGCLKNKYPVCEEFIKSFAQKDKQKALKLVSNLLINQLENWLCSTEFFDKNIKGREQALIQYSMNATTGEVKNERMDISLNLFEK